MIIVCIHGRAGSGKDTLANFLVKKNFIKIALADQIKKIAQELWGFNHNHLWGPSSLRNESIPRFPDLTPRDVLIKIGDAVNELDPYAWTRLVSEYIERIDSYYYKNAKNYFVIPDIRYLREYEYLKACFKEHKVIFIKIVRQSYQSNLLEKHKKHSSENEEINDCYFDKIINNKNIDDLEPEINEYIEGLL